MLFYLGTVIFMGSIVMIRYQVKGKRGREEKGVIGSDGSLIYGQFLSIIGAVDFRLWL